jgi:invasion protein IalB
MTLRPVFTHGLIAIAAMLSFSPLAQAQQSPERVQLAQAPGGASGAQPALLGTYGDWGAYSGSSGGRKVCFALSKPTSKQSEPPNRPRDDPYMFISTRPTENVRNEVSIIIGYGFKPESEASVEIGAAKFSMYTKNDGAWIKNAAEEQRMVEAMRKSGDLVVKGTSARGTTTTDRYSLKGLGQALDRTAQECK